jgi:hypothetical protein
VQTTAPQPLSAAHFRTNRNHVLIGFHARHIGSGVWGVFDAGVMGWRATNLSEDEAHQQRRSST